VDLLGLTEKMTMTELADATDVPEMIGPMSVDSIDQKRLAEHLLEQAREQNIELVGPGGLLGQLTKSVHETTLDAEMSEHLGYEKHDRQDAAAGTAVTGAHGRHGDAESTRSQRDGHTSGAPS